MTLWLPVLPLQLLLGMQQQGAALQLAARLLLAAAAGLTLPAGRVMMRAMMTL